MMCVEPTYLVSVARNVVHALHGALCYMFGQVDSLHNTPFSKLSVERSCSKLQFSMERRIKRYLCTLPRHWSRCRAL